MWWRHGAAPPASWPTTAPSPPAKLSSQALAAAAELELLAQQYVLSLSAGGPVLLSDAEVAEAIAQFGQVYGPNGAESLIVSN